ncbi:MAG TPA: hypothetical protein VG937_03160 [Polyangiaceae bacterium]|nr:hypothetical protein [Polyangiaceae bacterium]
MRRDLLRTLVLAALMAAVPGVAHAQATGSKVPRIGLDAGDPLSKSAPPATPFGRSPSTSKDSVLDFHGYILAPMNFAVLKREDPEPGQSSTALHSPPLIPQDQTRFEYTGVIPLPWIQLNFTYGNSTVSGTAIITSRSATDAAGIFDATKQPGIASAFVAVNLSQAIHTPFEVKVGVFTGRYGAMGEYDAGRYGTPLIARTNTVGVTTTAGVDLGKKFQLALEHGIGSSLNRPAPFLVPEGSNDFADSGAEGTPSADAPMGVGTTFVNHLHGVLGYDDVAQLGLHYFTAWTQDDLSTPGDIQDGKIGVLGADLRFTLGRGGHLYAGVAHTDLSHAAVVSGVIEVLNARGGPGLIREYLGPESHGNGGITVYGAQYDVSVARLLYGDFFKGVSPDVRLSLFGVGAGVKSDDPDHDGVNKLKVGAEVSYSALSWFGVSARFDHAAAKSDDSATAFNIFSPRLHFHTDWLSRDELALQYSYFNSGSDVIVRTGYPPSDDPGATPDQHVFSLSGSFWW